MNEFKKKLADITQILLKPEDEYKELKENVDALSQLFLQISNLKESDQENRADVFLSHGKAIGPFWAAKCVEEFMRTKRFVQGIYQGIVRGLERFPGQPLHILYAGTGPFATLALPLMTIFSSEEIQFIFLEINSTSIQYLKKVIQVFGVEDYIIDLCQCDASQYQKDPQQTIHMVITETMQNALKKEPQVGITINLVPQLIEGGILIPENIRVDVALIDPKRSMKRMQGLLPNGQSCYYPLGTIFDLNKETAMTYHHSDQATDGNYNFSQIDVVFPDTIPGGYRLLNLMTTIQVFENVFLNHWQCSLNLPFKIMDLEQVQQPIKKMSFQYVLNEEPGFNYEIC